MCLFPIKWEHEMKMQFTKEDMQIIMWKDIVLNNGQRNANFTAINDSKNPSLCRKQTPMVGRYLGRNLLDGNLLICVKKSKEKKK